MILCDLDGVLAVGPRRDTERGAPIYRTFREPPEELRTIQDAGIPLHIVTAKVEAEARQVLDAIGLSGAWDSVVGADRLFWPTIWTGLRGRRVPSALSKSAFRRLIPVHGARPVVMIEDQADNLREMLSASAIDFGILVPPFSVSGDRVSAGFDLNQALGLARRLSEGHPPLEATGSLDLSPADPDRIPDPGGPHEGLGWCGDSLGPVFRLPGWVEGDRERHPISLDGFVTGKVLAARRANLVSMVRLGRRISRSFMR